MRDHIFPNTGPPDTLIIDGAGAFVSDKFKEEMAALNVEVDMIAPDNHRANGLAERQVRVLNDIMRHLSEDNKRRWAAFLREIQYSMATTPSADTGISPYEMWTGYPMKRGDLRDPDLLDEPLLDPQAPRYMTRLQRALARSREESAAAQPKRSYEKTPAEFKVGDLVRIKLPESRRSAVDNATGQPRTYRKWVGSWATRAEIVADLGRNQFSLRNLVPNRVVKRSAQQLAHEGR